MDASEQRRKPLFSRVFGFSYMKRPFLLISPKIVPKIQLIKKGGCFEYHAVIADKMEYGLDAWGSLRVAFT